MTQNVSKTWTITAGDYIRDIEESDRIDRMKVTKQSATKRIVLTLLSGAAFGLVIFSISLLSKY